jgi:hypothetical protein
MTTDTSLLHVPGMPGHWHQTLTLPCGYQHFNWYPELVNPHGVYLNDSDGLKAALGSTSGDVYLYTHHKVFFEDGIIKQTRSSPNWEGGLVTYATCKHLMRTYDRSDWTGTWLVGLAPQECAGNTLLFAGVVIRQFPDNYTMGQHLKTNHYQTWRVKLANNNPRGDVYLPRRKLAEGDQHTHTSYVAPQGHTRSVEYYKSSPGSVSDRPDGMVPKWWRDVEYVSRGRRPVCFVLGPVWLFSRPCLWSSYSPRRAVLRLTPGAVAGSLHGRP